MTVGRDYLMKQPSRPSAPKQFLDRQIVPRAVNAVGRLEVTLERVAVRTGLRPAVILASGTVAGAFTVLGLWRKRGGTPVSPSEGGARLQ